MTSAPIKTTEKHLSMMMDLAMRGVSHRMISKYLEKDYGIQLSPNAVKKKLYRAGFSRKKLIGNFSRADVKRAIEKELENNPSSIGYRSMKDILSNVGVYANRDRVMNIMQEVDPRGVYSRRRRRLTRKIYRSDGPNQTWHIDGYDKLTPYGFAIHGAIDGYSRKIMWLSVCPSNKDPNVIAHYYTECVENVGGCPAVLQADPGTENVVVGALQNVFHDGQSFRIVKSVFNQRIEAWWSMFRRRYSDWWIHLFKDLSQFGQFNRGNNVDIMCLRYCFTTLIQNELDDVREIWNYHHISRSRQAVVPNGKPAILYDLPQETGGIDCKCPVSDDDIEWAYSVCTKPAKSGSLEFDGRAAIVEELVFKDSDTWENCLENYFLLRDHLEQTQ